MPEEARFRPSKPQNEMKVPSVDLDALRRQFEGEGGRGVSVMEQMVQDGSTMKKGAFLVDEASKYINEFVMPPVTPPPSANHHAKSQHAANGAHASNVEQVPPSVDIAERQMNEAKRLAEEKENALKKIIKKNKRMLGMA
jgi:CCR4-NOT transcription complex subunit 4